MKCIYLLILIPFLSFIFFIFFGTLFAKKKSKFFGVFFIFLELFVFLCICFKFFRSGNVFYEHLFTWISINRFNIVFSLLLDQLSFIMLSLLIFISFLIYLFSVSYMKSVSIFDYSRFFAYLNLFIASMVLLVLSDNIILMYFGWEIVGLCSYLLIGFYNVNKNNGFYASKAFLITRIGDVFLFIAILMLNFKFNTCNFNDINMIINNITLIHTNHLFLITLFLFFGAIGKSAQFPLHIWLSDAMVGPTPVSALIHSATMITAGVYLITRMHYLFILNPFILLILRISGLLTIIIGCICALAAKDLKKILAYSTISQIGYMFLSLGVKAWDAAMIHLVIHGMFKALLFLTAASLIIYCNNQNIFKMLICKKNVFFLYISFIFGCLSLISFPIITSGFYSKENILFNILQNGNLFFFSISLLCTFLTSIYTFKMFFLIFNYDHDGYSIPISSLMQIFPMVILVICSTYIGFLFLPNVFNVFSYKIFSHDYKLILGCCSGLLSILGIFCAYYLWILNKTLLRELFKYKYICYFYKMFYKSFYFDLLYKYFFVSFYNKISKILYHDPVNKINSLNVYFLNFIGQKIILCINSYLRWYITLTIFSFLIILSIMENL
ncbi:NADH-quinone oxidoreductase subunit L [Buchnera aphidicola (Mollitrichosiphum nigrofasciatum)]|uniref:NADH-quinone oxidoreductase subunit L n=1 Tax=Buchnera aphidicola TaxID=9 RepID=UPI0031B883CA